MTRDTVNQPLTREETIQHLKGNLHDTAVYAPGSEYVCGLDPRTIASALHYLTETPAPEWQPIETAPKIHPLNGGDCLLLAWLAPGIGEWIIVTGSWRDGWFEGSNKAFPTHWMPLPEPPR